MYELLIVFMFFIILLNCMAIISIRLMPCRKTSLQPDYNAADNYIEYYSDNDGCKYNLSVYREYLAVHFAKYPNGILPKQPMILECRSHDVDYKMEFYDCQNPKTVKYLKQAMILLREKRKPLKVIREANKIIRRTKRMATVS